MLLLCVGCSTMHQPSVARHADSAAAAATRSVSHDGFLIAADRLDTWNAVGQLLVRTDGVQFEGRSEMLDLHAVRYRGEGLLVLTPAVPLSDDVRESTTRVVAAAQDGSKLDSVAASELLAMLERALPAEIAQVRATQAAGAATVPTRPVARPRTRRR